MNLTETYANNIGIKLPKKPARPYINFTPIPDGDYVVIEFSQDLMSLNYDYFNEVIIALKEHDLKIAQIGSPSGGLLNGVEDFRGKINFSQTCYLIENSKLVISGDTAVSYAANLINIPTITLYGPTIASVNKPFYSNPKSIFLESHRDGLKASLNLQEQPKTINLIKPEIITKFALDILNIKTNKEIQTLFVGNGYPHFIFEVLPQAGVPLLVAKEALLNIRLDRNFDEQGAGEILSKYKGSIMTHKRINPALFSLKNLSRIIYRVDNLEDLDLDFIKFIESRKIGYQVLTENEGIMNDLKLHLFDHQSPILKSNPEPILDLSGTPFKTSRILFANSKTYVSYWHYLNNLPQPEKSLESKIPDTLDSTFWENRDSIYVYNTTLL